jgi:hypothetical protein
MGVPPTAPRRNGNGSLTGHCRFPSESDARFPPFRAANGNGPISPAPDRRAGLAFFALPNGRSLRDQAAFFGRSGPIHTGVVGATGRAAMVRHMDREARPRPNPRDDDPKEVTAWANP